MNIKIQGGGSGKYANSGSSIGVMSYLDKNRSNDILPEYFNNERNDISGREAALRIDKNKAKLCRSDAKFYVMTVSPSAKEIDAMGNTPEERIKNFREYIRQGVMQNYAENFNKGLNKEDIEYYARIHYDRGHGGHSDMHCHVVISRKDRTDRIKLSPRTNHRGTERGVVKGGFDRVYFFNKCEHSFDNRFYYERGLKEQFKYCNAVKNGSPNKIKELTQGIGKALGKSLTREISRAIEPMPIKIIRNVIQSVIPDRDQKSGIGY